MSMRQTPKTGSNGGRAGTAPVNLITLTLVPLRESLRLVAGVQRSALETFSRLGVLGPRPLLSASEGSSDAPRRVPLTAAATVEAVTDRATRTRKPAAKRTATAKPSTTKRPTAAKPSTTKRPTAAKPSTTGRPAGQSASKTPPAVKRAPKPAVRNTAGTKSTAAKRVAPKTTRSRSTPAGAATKA